MFLPAPIPPRIPVAPAELPYVKDMIRVMVPVPIPALAIAIPPLSVHAPEVQVQVITVEKLDREIIIVV